MKGKVILLALSLIVLIGYPTYYIKNVETPTQVEVIDKTQGYETKLFDGEVHKLNLIIDYHNWKNMLDNPLEEEYCICDMEIDGVLFEDVAIRTKGNTTLKIVAEDPNSDRYSFKVKFNKYNKEQTCFGLDEFALNNVLADTTYVKEYLSYDLFHYMNVPAPLCTFMDISVNGKPWGFYVCVEAIDDSFLTRNFGSDYGKLYKPEAEEVRNFAQNGNPESITIKGEDLFYTNDDFESYSTIFETAKTDITDEDKTRLIHSIKVLNSGKDIDTIMDVDTVVRFWAVNNFLCNTDFYLTTSLHNFYLYEKDGIMSAVPWDYNLSFGTHNMGTTEETINYPIFDLPVMDLIKGRRPLYEKVMEVPEYKELYIKYLYEIMDEYFESNRFNSKYTELLNMINPYIEKDPSRFYNLEEIEKGQETLIKYIDLRSQSIKGQIEGTIIYGDYDTYIDCSSMDINDLGHQKEYKEKWRNER